MITQYEFDTLRARVKKLEEAACPKSTTKDKVRRLVFGEQMVCVGHFMKSLGELGIDGIYLTLDGGGFSFEAESYTSDYSATANDAIISWSENYLRED